jgi:hypothetical protein
MTAIRPTIPAAPSARTFTRRAAGRSLSTQREAPASAKHAAVEGFISARGSPSAQSLTSSAMPTIAQSAAAPVHKP